MSLNTDEPEYEGSRSASTGTGETMTEAVTVALQERIARLRRSRKADATAAELLAIGTRCAAS
jgi:hypothetical protein